MSLLKNRKFQYWSYRDGGSGTIEGQTAICALKKVFDAEIVWSHGSPIYDQGVYVVTDRDLKYQFSVTIREID